MPTTKALPPVTEAHRQAAFRAMCWLGWSYEQAMADSVRSRLVNLRARQLCNTEDRVLRRVPVVDTRPGQHFQTGQRVWIAATDCKRAAAGDIDDIDD